MIQYKYGIWIWMTTIAMVACQSNETTVNPMDTLPDTEAGTVIKKAIDYAGTWDEWERKKSFSFYKNITQIDSTGALIRKVRQLHQYNLGDQLQMRMTWSIDSTNYLIINDGSQAKKYQDNEELTDKKSKNEAWNSSFGSHYVIGMPYKLTDPGVTLTYEGIDKTVLDIPVHSVKVEYAEGAGSTGGMHDWWYYFTVDHYDLAAFFLDYGEGHSLTTYENFEEVDGMRIHNKRYSYKSNAQKEKVQLKTIYENEEMKFNQELDPNLFRLQ